MFISWYLFLTLLQLYVEVIIMNEFKMNVDIEPTDKYQKAKLDLLQAIKSFESLTPDNRKRLIEEVFGVARVAAVMELINNIY